MNKHIDDYMTGLDEVWDELRAGTIERGTAQELANIAGKVISGRKLQLAYHALRRERPVIPFLAAPVEAGPVPAEDAIAAAVVRAIAKDVATASHTAN